MPVQDHSQPKKTEEQLFKHEDEKDRQSVRNAQENSVTKSQKLLPFLHVKAESHQIRIDNLNEKIAVREDKIARNKAGIEKLSAKADRLEDRNTVLKNTLGGIPAVRRLIEANERKIAEIRENKIPKREKKIQNHKAKINQFSAKRNRIEHKLNRVLALNDAIKSFSIRFHKERREVFTDAMDRLNAANTDCLSDKRNALNEQKARLSEEYSLPQTSAVDKYNLQTKINGINDKISCLEDKIHKLALPRNHFAEQTNDIVDAAMKVTADKIAEVTDNSEIGTTELANAVLKEAEGVESLDLSEIANLADNFNYGSKAEAENLPEKTLPAMDGNGKINPGYYKSLTKENRFIGVETKENAKRVMALLDVKNVPYSAVERKNGVVAVTVAKQHKSTYTKISDHVKSERAVQYVNPDFFKALPKEERTTQRMSQENAERKISELSQKNIPHSAVLNGSKSAVTVAKKDFKTAFFSRDKLKQSAQKISNKSQDQNKTQNKNQGLE